MNFLKRLIGSSSGTPKKWLKRAPRVVLKEIHDITFTQKSGNGEKVYRLFNISFTGLGLISAGQDRVLMVGQEISGDLKIGDQRFPIPLQVRHANEKLVGCAFGQENYDLRRAIEKYLQVEILAIHLNKIHESLLKADPRGQAVWFADGSGNEVYCVMDASGILDFHMTFLGNYIEGGRSRRLRMGTASEESAQGSPKHKGSALVLNLSSEVVPATVKVACELIQYAEKIPPALKDELTSLLHQTK